MSNVLKPTTLGLRALAVKYSNRVKYGKILLGIGVTLHDIWTGIGSASMWLENEVPVGPALN